MVKGESPRVDVRKVLIISPILAQDGDQKNPQKLEKKKKNLLPLPSEEVCSSITEIVTKAIACI